MRYFRWLDYNIKLLKIGVYSGNDSILTIKGRTGVLLQIPKSNTGKNDMLPGYSVYFPLIAIYS